MPLHINNPLIIAASSKIRVSKRSMPIQNRVHISPRGLVGDILVKASVSLANSIWHTANTFITYWHWNTKGNHECQNVPEGQWTDDDICFAWRDASSVEHKFRWLFARQQLLNCDASKFAFQKTYSGTSAVKIFRVIIWLTHCRFHSLAQNHGFGGRFTCDIHLFVLMSFIHLPVLIILIISKHIFMDLIICVILLVECNTLLANGSI